jgi:L-asparaginase/Glu-tRNA(Gln) amidotransferase subunit D
MELESSEMGHTIRYSSHSELGKYVNVLVLYTGGTIGMYGTEDGWYTYINLLTVSLYLYDQYY